MAAFRPSFVAAQADAKGKAKEKGQDLGLNLDVPPELRGQESKTVKDVLLASMPPKGAQRFFAARDGDGNVYSLQEGIPAHVDALTFLTFFSLDDAGRQAFWLTATYVFNAALQAHLGDGVRIAAPPSIGALGGSGFATSYFFDEGAGSPSVSTGSTSNGKPLQASIDLINSSPASVPPRLSPEQLSAVEHKFQELIDSDAVVRLQQVSIKEAEFIFLTNPFKREELAARYGQDGQEGQVTLVCVGDDYFDLAPAQGTWAVLSSAGPIKAFKIQDVSTATWTPLEVTHKSLVPSRQSLLHLRGLAFPDSKFLKAHLAAMREAQSLDHRALGLQQRLFITHDSSPGTPFMLPHGMRIVRKVERVVRDLYDVWGYDEVVTPQLFKSDLWKRSGHWENYRQDMFAVEGFKEREQGLVPADSLLPAEEESREESRACCDAHSHQGEPDRPAAVLTGTDEAGASFGLKPMNCPGHCLVFASQGEHSYRDLPIRYAEFSPLHRNESSGSLSGLTRVRRFHQDDAHVFCRPDQVEGEISSMLKMLADAYTTFGFGSAFELVLSTRPAAFIGSVEEWKRAEDGLERALDASGHTWQLNEGDGAFYGPKIDVRLVDALGKKHQTATIQLDFQLPRRFELSYSDDKGARQTPVLIHRAILGSVERFMAILMEHTRGNWPFWMSPRQAVVLPVSPQNAEGQMRYAEAVKKRLALGRSEDNNSSSRPAHVFHVDVDASEETLAKRVRRAESSRYNFILVVGDDEVSNGTVNVRARPSTATAAYVNAVADQGQAPTRPQLEREMGQWKLEDLRDLFIKLDSNHW
ncbi:threonyl-tRNA synthetase [Acaromyces ingoldii]|uniref:threonine--tRNA ligase n=1 Tax=Acaromyces ingoldii TaxID=215250 RepID=A0A316YMS8_9BASI|nr:threonyl-tRNA synthetase [Acaromyces ingoldii]PWN90114.1 threonyl-tRNA synthetase [Acaromyces ingoldii]